jgi:FkbM family methyltransferase
MNDCYGSALDGKGERQAGMDVFIDPRFAELYRQNPLVLVDVGARGGLKSNWLRARQHLRLLGFEPDAREFTRLAELAGAPGRSDKFFNTALHDRRGSLRLHVARDGGLSSIFEPDRAFLDAFPDAGRFDTIDIQQVEADTLDDQLRAHAIDDVDFVKADTQGSELSVLQGGAGALASSVTGVEVEVEFTPIYKNQPLFADVDAFLRGLGFLLFDLRPCYWKRAAGRSLGGPRGQVIWADALYLKGTPALSAGLAPLGPELRKSKVLRAVSISLLYGYYDYALEIVRVAGDVLAADERRVIEQRLRESSAHGGVLSQFPGRRRLALALRRLWKTCVPRDDAWSVSDAEIGNLG